jgi:hypothetical protein
VCLFLEQDECPTYTPNINRDDVVLAAALAAKWKEPAKDALDTMVLGKGTIYWDMCAQCDPLGIKSPEQNALVKCAQNVQLSLFVDLSLRCKRPARPVLGPS